MKVQMTTLSIGSFSLGTARPTHEVLSVPQPALSLPFFFFLHYPGGVANHLLQ